MKMRPVPYVLVIAVTGVVAAASARSGDVAITGSTFDCWAGAVEPARQVEIWAVDPVSSDSLLATLRNMDTVTWTGDGIESMARFEEMYDVLVELLIPSAALARDTTDSDGRFELLVPSTDSLLVVAHAQLEDEPVYYSYTVIPGRADTSIALDMTRGHCTP